jgi:hypothetical protein
MASFDFEFALALPHLVRFLSKGEHTRTETQKELAEALKCERPIVRLWWD